MLYRLFKAHPGITDFSKHKNFGYVNTRIADLGCGMQVSMVLNLDHIFTHHPEFVHEVEKKYEVGFEKIETLRKKKTFVVYNKKQLGTTESTIIQHVWEAAHMMIEKEKELEKVHGAKKLF